MHKNKVIRNQYTIWRTMMDTQTDTETPPANQDIDGNELSLFVTEAVQELRRHSNIQRAECTHHASGKIRTYMTDRNVYGTVFEIAEEMGYEPAFARTAHPTEVPRDVTTLDDVGVGYAVFVPAKDHGHGYSSDPIKAP